MGKTYRANDNDSSDRKIRNPIQRAMIERYRNTDTVFRDRRNRRPKDRRAREIEFDREDE